MASQPTTTTAADSSEKPGASITLHPRPSPAATAAAADGNPLPPLLQTPAGLALLELQGTINLPGGEDDGGAGAAAAAAAAVVGIGRVDFPDWRPGEGAAWTRRAYLYVGAHQRLTGEVRELPRALGVVRRRRREGGGEGGGDDELEIVGVVKHKIVFSSRPEPVGTE